MTEQTDTNAIPIKQKPDAWSRVQFDWERWAPRTLMARASLIIVVPLIVVQIISTYIFYENHWDTMSRRMAASLAGDIAASVNFIRDYPGEQNLNWLRENANRTLGFELKFEAGAKISETAGTDISNAMSGDVLADALWEALNKPFRIDLAAYRADKMISIDVQLENGVLHVLAPRRRLFSSTTYVFVIWMVGSSILLFGVATAFLRNQVQSVRRLARAVDEFGKGRDISDFPAEGAFEVRQAARAFNIMRTRIKRQITQRTEMLAGVSHDLRTPLTRMKLQLEMLKQGIDPEEIAALKDDAAEMERMLDAYLAFARGEGNEDSTPTDAGDVIESIAARFRRDGAHVTIDVDHARQSVPLRPVAFERCLNNLIGNAVRYAKAVTVTARIQGQALTIMVDDDGPGIPIDKREDVFRPFTRLEASRNPKTGGVGLGLTIARDIVRSMGGEITLNDSPAGGLRVNLRIPL
jgi:two-component system, OmpR family, osmolarity sensor histidine kinase EnvZ